jgi:hypothetical protein
LIVKKLPSDFDIFPCQQWPDLSSARMPRPKSAPKFQESTRANAFRA